MESDAMKIITAALTESWRFGMSFTNAIALFICCGCAHLATVKTTPARIPARAASDQQLEPARKYLAAAEDGQQSISLGHDLIAAKLACEVLERRPYDDSTRSIYNFAVARTVEDIERTDLQPWRHSTTVLTDQGNY